MVICPYSQQYEMRNIMQQNSNQQIMETFGEKEGNQPNENNCQWKEGKLTDLINKHILKCATTNNPTFALNVKIKNLEHEIIKLRTENNMKSDKIIEIRNENEDLRKELAAEKNESVNMRLMYDEEKDKLLQEQEALNGIIDEERRKIDVLKNDFAAKEKAAINAQKQEIKQKMNVIEETRKKYKELRAENKMKSDKIVESQNENEELRKELAA
eukprot:UN00931